MKSLIRSFTFLGPILMPLFLSSCGDLLIGQRRDAAFYKKDVATKTAPTKVDMASEKFIYSDKYPMRFAMFNNQRFYYQIDELGDGWGTWSQEDGVMKLFASRPYFDMRLVLSGQDAEGDTQILKFRDRTGIQTVAVDLRDPEKAKAEGSPLPPLRKFTQSKDGF